MKPATTGSSGSGEEGLSREMISFHCCNCDCTYQASYIPRYCQHCLHEACRDCTRTKPFNPRIFAEAHQASVADGSSQVKIHDTQTNTITSPITIAPSGSISQETSQNERNLSNNRLRCCDICASYPDDGTGEPTKHEVVLWCCQCNDRKAYYRMPAMCRECGHIYCGNCMLIPWPPN